MSKIQKVRNWKEYNKSLKKRGAIILSFDEKYYSELYYTDKQKRGGKRLYSKQMYEYLLTIKVIFRLTWRSTIGFAEAILYKMRPESDVLAPDYGHASRECGKLDLKIRPVNFKEGGLEIAFDSTGVNVYSTSGWHQRKHGKDALYRKRDQWKKIHVAIDLDNMQVLSVVYTDSNVNDCEVVQELCSNIKASVKTVRADGAYDTEEFRKIIYEWGAQDLIPPAVTSKAQDELKNRPKIMKNHLEQRDRMIKEIREYENFPEGLKAWKVNSGYHQRSKIESFMCRFKRSFGFNLQQKTDNGRINEIITKMNILNLMASFGRAEYSS
jgi:Transposase DDE domain